MDWTTYPNKGDCTNCPLTCNPIGYRGPIESPVVVLGQSPGADEVQQGIPFVGVSGRLLMEVLHTVGFDLNNVLYYNTCQCRPATSDELNLQAIHACAPNVDQIIGAHPREIIIALGNEAWAGLHQVTKVKGGVRTGCGRILRSERFDCYGVWSVHPAFVLRSPGWKENLEHALKRAYRVYHGKQPERPDCIIHPVPTLLIDVEDALGDIDTADVVSIDIETSSLRVGERTWKRSHETDHVLGLGVGFRDGGKELQSLYIPFSHGDPPKPVWSPAEWTAIYRLIRDRVFADEPMVLGQNANFDMRYLRHQYGINRYIDFDTMIAHKLIDENKPHGLKPMARFYLGAPDYDIGDDVPVPGHMGCLPLEQVAEYCCYDTIYTLLLYELFNEMFDKEPKLKRLFENLDTPLFNELLNVELEGMIVDMDTHATVDAAMQDELSIAQQTVDETSGFAGKYIPHNWHPSKKDPTKPLKSSRMGVNPNSTKDIPYIIFDHFGIRKPEGNLYTNKAGDPRTDDVTIQKILSTVEGDHPAVPFIKAFQRYRSLSTIYGTHVKGLLETICLDGRVHTTYGFKQANPDDLRSPGTGRLSSSGPNMQNMPKPFRPMFVAPDGWLIVEADYTALEVVIWCEASRDPNLLSALATGDYHRYTAAIALGVPEDEITEEQRAASKVATFGGVMYGGGTTVLCRAFEWSEYDAQKFLDAMYAAYPVGKAWLDNTVEHCKQHGWVETMFGRKRRLPEIWASDHKLQRDAIRQAMNSPIQGGAAEVTNYALIRTAEMIRRLDIPVKTCNTVHDNIMAYVREDVVDEFVPLMEAEMTRPPFKGFSTPLAVEITVGKTWGGELDLSKVRQADKEK